MTRKLMFGHLVKYFTRKSMFGHQRGCFARKLREAISDNCRIATTKKKTVVLRPSVSREHVLVSRVHALECSRQYAWNVLDNTAQVHDRAHFLIKVRRPVPNAKQLTQVTLRSFNDSAAAQGQWFAPWSFFRICLSRDRVVRLQSPPKNNDSSDRLHHEYLLIGRTPNTRC